MEGACGPCDLGGPCECKPGTAQVCSRKRRMMLGRGMGGEIFDPRESALGSEMVSGTSRPWQCLAARSQ